MKDYYNVLLILVMSCASFAVQSNELESLRDSIKEEVMATCNDEAFLTCIGIDKKKCAASVEKSLSTCDHLIPKDIEDINEITMKPHGDCLSKNLLENAGISQSKLDSCDQ